MRPLSLALIVAVGSWSCKGATPSDPKAAAPGDAADSSGFALTSPAFAQGGAIPAKYTCEGADVSPELAWRGAPATIKSFALIVDDPDAPGGTFTHWLLYDLSATTSGLPEGAKKAGLEGTTSWDKTGWGGPCPPSGTHRYFFKLFALDVGTLGKAGGVARDEVEKAMEGHVVGRATLQGTYAKHGP